MSESLDFGQLLPAPSLPPSLPPSPGRGCCVSNTRKKALSSTAPEVEEGGEEGKEDRRAVRTQIS